MSFHVLYAPHPPQFTLELTPGQLAQRDCRFANLWALRGRGVLALAVQDSADLQQAHLTVREGRAEWRGTPGALDEGRPHPARLPFSGWSERALEDGLGLDPGHVRVREVGGAGLAAEFAAWPAGIVYLFAQEPGAPHPGVARRLNLTHFLDRLEAEFLGRAAFAGFPLVRAHRLGADGSMEVLRAGLDPAPAVPARLSQSARARPAED